MLRIKNWKRFQHFKDRRPPWIKLHRDVLDDMEWYELDPVAAKHLVMVWLIASEDEGKEGRLPGIKELAFRLRISEKQVESTMLKLSHWLIRDDIAAISQGYQDGPPEKSREEAEKETKEKAKPQPPVAFILPPSIRPEVWKAFEEHRIKKRAPMTDHAKHLMVEACGKIGGDPNELLEHAILSGWQKVFPIKKIENLSGNANPTPSKSSALCVVPGCDKLGIVGQGGRMFCRKHDPEKMGV